MKFFGECVVVDEEWIVQFPAVLKLAAELGNLVHQRYRF